VGLSSNISFEVYDDFIVRKTSLGHIKCTFKELLEQQHLNELIFKLERKGSLKICVWEETDMGAAEVPLTLADAAKNQLWTLLQPMDVAAFQSFREIVQSLFRLVQIVNDFSKIHPYVQAAWSFVSSVFHIIREQLDRDGKILTLVSTMKTLYSFVSPLDSFRKENPTLHQPLENMIKDILKQTVECVGCVVFILAYSGHSFASENAV